MDTTEADRAVERFCELFDLANDTTTVRKVPPHGIKKAWWGHHYHAYHYTATLSVEKFEGDDPLADVVYRQPKHDGVKVEYNTVQLADGRKAVDTALRGVLDDIQQPGQAPWSPFPFDEGKLNPRRS